MNAAVNEGSELPLELKRAKVNLAASQERLSASQLDLDYYEMMLAVALGFPATDRVKPVDSDLSATPTPPTRQRRCRYGSSQQPPIAPDAVSGF